MDSLTSAGNEAIASYGTRPSRCPHSTRADATPDACSLCRGINVERVRPRDDAEAFAAALEALRPRRGRPRMHTMPQRKRLPLDQATTQPSHAPQLGPDEMLGGDVARMLGVTRQRVSQLAGMLGAARRGRVVVFSRQALDAYMREQAERAKTDGCYRLRGATTHEGA